MNDYYALRVDVKPCDENVTDYMAAVLGEIGYESFVPDVSGLTAYVKSELFDLDAARKALNEDFPFKCSFRMAAELVPGQDWNAEWERNYFRPIVVGDNQCVIHSSFHTDIPDAVYDIVIDPKMAFGTGHHATTSLMIARLLELDLVGKTVTDMGTGTGILAILAAMRGASCVSGVEIDGFAYDNAVDNVRINGHSEISLYNGDAGVLPTLPLSDVFIANINRNVITSDMDKYAANLKPGGTMLLSGFYEKDLPVVEAAARQSGLSKVNHYVKGEDWTCLQLVKPIF